ncbi:MAG TPA: helix-turn-helix transcriptional regulator [Rickettsiales bacterium]|nr:helix-turn-helix transcriptional regulator [Rickettsiales bacterium]
MKKSIYSDRYRALCGALIAARKAAGITQQQLADRLKKPQSFVAKYENGERRLDVAEFMTIAEELGVDPAKILAKNKR